VQSTPGIGPTLTVCLPQLPHRAVRPEQQIRPEGPAHTRGSGMILLIEDEDGVRELARRVLEEEGYTVRDVRGGADAVAILDAAGAEIDLVLADVIVPDVGTV
jgi:two-component system cell cycle sensor histidine kinase/response regulator CckA